MNNIVRFVGSAVITLILVSIPALLVVSIEYEWNVLLKLLLCVATAVEGALAMCLIYERSEE